MPSSEHPAETSAKSPQSPQFPYRRVSLGPAPCAIDLGDGSERGEYVNQDYILHRLGRPMRAINLMYCYYPKDEGWPKRVSEAFADKEVSFAWDYPYDDYFPYTGGLGGNRDGDAFRQMREIRRHGQDVVLTLTIDPTLPDEHIEAIARDLRTFGRLQLRINHEATGNWFSFNKRASYEEVAKFFARCCEIIHREAPNVQVILCLDGCKDTGSEKMEKEDAFIPAIQAADIVSVDRYLALHWGWPYDVADEATNQYALYQVEEIYALAKKSAKRYDKISGKHKPMVLSELNADGDVTGAYEQARMVREFCDLLKKDPERWLAGFTLYQFRDRGRLGLEIEDPNNPEVGIEQPLMQTFRGIIREDFFSPSLTAYPEPGGVLSAEGIAPYHPLPLDGEISLRWGGSEDAEGVAVELSFDGSPIFCEAYFGEELKEANLLMELSGKWFYKAPGVTFIDLMDAFDDGTGRQKELGSSGKTLALNIFAPPASGENDPADAMDYYTTLRALPYVRIQTKPIA